MAYIHFTATNFTLLADLAKLPGSRMAMATPRGQTTSVKFVRKDILHPSLLLFSVRFRQQHT